MTETKLKRYTREFKQDAVALGCAAARPRTCIDSGRRTGDLGSSATFKKSDSLLRESKIVRLAFMKNHQNRSPARAMAEVLQVSASASTPGAHGSL